MEVIVSSLYNYMHHHAFLAFTFTFLLQTHLKIMKVTLVLLVLACAISLAYGDQVCGSSYCKDNPCTAKISAKACKTPALYRANHAGKCACCPACVTLLSEGAACKTYSKELGETPSAVCREPLKCLKGVCTKVAPRS
ncbi:fungal protease inhibitor-1-like [Pieris napi]|uniref:fungal protease inhibitor-1-like n=1 Tax=Pieris napi TaxID=78633 RepID=UPI001FB9EC7E|nr:fungal protease inhibitor-1-like [Pieris napi]